MPANSHCLRARVNGKGMVHCKMNVKRGDIGDIGDCNWWYTCCMCHGRFDMWITFGEERFGCDH